MRKTLYTLNIGDYCPEITRLTYPLMRRWAKKIGADFVVISDRKWPQYEVVYEKLQIYDLAASRGDDWSIYLDGDALVHPNNPDWTEFLRMDTVSHHGRDMAGNRWRYDDVFRRDGRHIGSCNWCAFASRWCRDLWAQPDISYEQCLEAIFPTQAELNSGVIKREHLIDDYILSRNIARFGLKYVELLALMRDLGPDHGGYFWHQYIVSHAQKLAGWDVDTPQPDGSIKREHNPGMLEVLHTWGITPDGA